MSDAKKSSNYTNFFMLSALFWVFVFLATVLSEPVAELMDRYFTGRSEYTLLEQGTKLYLLFMLIGSLIAYRNEEEPSRILLGLTFLLFGTAMYLAESNFISETWQSLFGAVFISAIVWQLLKIDLIALALVFCGCAGITLGMLGDFLSEHSGILTGWPPIQLMVQIIVPLEEYLDLWGVAFFTYASLFLFRSILARFFVNNRLSLIILVFSAVLIASGNSFVHWQYHPGRTLQAMGTIMALLGFFGVVLVEWMLLRGELQFGFFNRSVFFRNFALLFVVLPVIYGGVWYVLNLVLWLCFFIYSGAHLYQSHPRLSLTASTDSIAARTVRKQG